MCGVLNSHREPGSTGGKPQGNFHTICSRNILPARGERHLVLMAQETAAGHSSMLVLGATSRKDKEVPGCAPELFPGMKILPPAQPRGSKG